MRLERFPFMCASLFRAMAMSCQIRTLKIHTRASVLCTPTAITRHSPRCTLTRTAQHARTHHRSPARLACPRRHHTEFQVLQTRFRAHEGMSIEMINLFHRFSLAYITPAQSLSEELEESEACSGLDDSSGRSSMARSCMRAFCSASKLALSFLSSRRRSRPT